jgi:hypothetical protein
MTKLKKLYLLVDTSTGLEAVARDTKFLSSLESSTTEIHEGWFITKEDLVDILGKVVERVLKKYGVKE